MLVYKVRILDNTIIYCPLLCFTNNNNCFHHNNIILITDNILSGWDESHVGIYVILDS